MEQYKWRIYQQHEEPGLVGTRALPSKLEVLKCTRIIKYSYIKVESRNSYTHFTEYKFAAMLSAALSRIHDLPPLLVLKRIPLPPAAQASSCIHNFANVFNIILKI